MSILAFVVSLASFSFAWAASRSAARAEEIKNLLGEKESVAFGALKLLRDGLPGEPRTVGPRGALLQRGGRLGDDSRQRALVIGALMSACLFESSDRARALLLSVIEKYRGTPFRGDFEHQYELFKDTIESMKRYDFTPKEFDPGSAEVRLEAVRKVMRYETASDAGK